MSAIQDVTHSTKDKDCAFSLWLLRVDPCHAMHIADELITDTFPGLIALVPTSLLQTDDKVNKYIPRIFSSLACWEAGKGIA